jgi:hypothetical protein
VAFLHQRGLAIVRTGIDTIIWAAMVTVKMLTTGARYLPPKLNAVGEVLVIRVALNW